MTGEWEWRRGDTSFVQIIQEELRSLWTGQDHTGRGEARQGVGVWRSAAGIGLLAASAGRPAASAANSPSKSTAGSPPPIRRLLGKRISLVVIVLVLVGICLKDRALFEPSHEEIYQEYRLIMTQTYELAERRASDAEWAAFEQEAQQRLAPINAELLELCKRTVGNQPTVFGSADYNSVTVAIRWPLTRIGREFLPKFIKDCRSGRPVDQSAVEVERKMQEVRSALDAVSFNPSLKGE